MANLFFFSMCALVIIGAVVSIIIDKLHGDN